MKKLICIAICGFVIAGQAFSRDKASQKNLVENPSFEELNKDGKLVFWKPVKAGYKISKKIFRSGKQSFVVKGKDIVGGVNAIIDVPKPGCKLLFKVHIYIKSYKSGALKPIHVSYKSKGRMYYRPQVNLFANKKNIRYNTWIEYKAVLDLSKYPDVKKIVFWCLGYASKSRGTFEGEVYWDDVSVEVID